MGLWVVEFDRRMGGELVGECLHGGGGWGCMGVGQWGIHAPSRVFDGSPGVLVLRKRRMEGRESTAVASSWTVGVISLNIGRQCWWNN